MYVFVGDYTDPYYGWELVTHEQMIEEIKAIFKFAEEHPDNVILLYGNHDLQYILGRAGTNRYDYEHANEISRLMIENENLCHGVAYQVCEKYLITHAGVTMDWYTHRCEYNKDNLGKESLEEICRHINDVWFSNKEKTPLLAVRESWYIMIFKWKNKNSKYFPMKKINQSMQI